MRQHHGAVAAHPGQQRQVLTAADRGRPAGRGRAAVAPAPTTTAPDGRSRRPNRQPVVVLIGDRGDRPDPVGEGADVTAGRPDRHRDQPGPGRREQGKGEIGAGRQRDHHPLARRHAEAAQGGDAGIDGRVQFAPGPAARCRDHRGPVRMTAAAAAQQVRHVGPGVGGDPIVSDSRAAHRSILASPGRRAPGEALCRSADDAPTGRPSCTTGSRRRSLQCPRLAGADRRRVRRAVPSSDRGPAIV